MPLPVKKPAVVTALPPPKVETPESTQPVVVVAADVMVAMLRQQQQNDLAIAKALNDAQRRPATIHFKVTARDRDNRICEAVMTPVYANE